MRRLLPVAFAVLLLLRGTALPLPETANCMIDQGPCFRTVATRQVAFEITPRPPKLMTEILFSVAVTGRNPEPAMLLELTMPGMFMGRNEVLLKKSADGVYRGKGILPRCPSGKSLWRAEVTIPGAGKASYLFDVSR